MRPHRLLGVATPALASGLLLSCRSPDGPSGPWVDVSVGGVTVHSRPGVRVCPESVARIDRLTNVVARKLRVAPPESVDYYFLPFDEAGISEVSDACVDEASAEPARTLGCAYPQRGQVFASVLDQVHELTHVIANRGLSRRCRFTSEGLATWLDFDLNYEFSYDGTVTGLFEMPSGSADAYRKAGTFIGHLAEKYGVESVMELHRRCPYGLSPAELDAELASIFSGESLEMASEIQTSNYHVPLRFKRCQGYAEATSIALGEELLREPSCDAGFGTSDDPKHEELLHVPQGLRRVLVSGEGSVSLENCDGGTPLHVRAGDAPLTAFVNFESETYRLEVASNRVSIRVEEAAALSECIPNYGGEFAAVAANQRLILLPAEGQVALPLHFERPTELAVTRSNAWVLCDADCDCEPLEDPSCQDFSCTPRRLSVNPNQDYWLVAHGNPGLSHQINLL
jgi:hypothetical protein